MLKTFFASLAAFTLLMVLAGGIIFGAKSITVSVQKELYQSCLDTAEARREAFLAPVQMRVQPYL